MFLYVMLFFLLLNSAWGLLLTDDPEGGVEEDQELGKAILEMLHINKLSAPLQAKPHPYMRQVYQLLDTEEPQDWGSSDGTLVQSFRSVVAGPPHAPPGWIWFNVSHLEPSMAVAELVLLRKTLHPDPLSVTVALHSLTHGAGGLRASPALEERLLTLDQLPLSGYDVFDVSPFMLSPKPPEVVGFQLRYTDESGSLVLHEALTQSLYCLRGGSLSEPLLVVYRARALRTRMTGDTDRLGPERRQRQHCHTVKRHQKRRFLRTGNQPGRRETASGPHCRLRRRYIDFHQGGLANWILQPSGFNATFCRGSCHFGNLGLPVNGFRPRRRPTEDSSSCVPLKLSSLTVMYRSETDDIIIEKFRDARAESCMCQPRPYH
ncbi:bone morphogenetic protein 4 isoform X1 [Esox lucius]|uniref:bone morphogenetic protein 4 isoform X1 n=1 Tax=Esox lucius TaxID=8010 RepID=UPI001476F314|nr:bone morphogenetic protein 4 isoform X1 [Esox lucius]